MNILCVDDDARILHVLKILLSQDGLTPLCASDHAEAMELFHKHQSDLSGALLDIRLVGKSGVDIARDIRRTSKLPLIAVSAYLDDVTLSQCRDAGFTAYINKPFDAMQLLKAVREVFGKHAAQPTDAPPPC